MAFNRFAALCTWATLSQTTSVFYVGNAYYKNSPMSLRIPTQGSGYNQFSTCFYINLKSPIRVTQQIPILSYLAGNAQTSEIVFQLEYERQISRLFIGEGNGAYFQMVPPTNQWTHICLTWDGYLGLVNAYVDGVPTGMANGVQRGYQIPGQGVWNLGHSKLDVGQVTQLHVWDRVISVEEVQQVLQCSLAGNVLSWDSSSVKYNVFKEPVASYYHMPYPCVSDAKSCPEHSTTSPLDREDLDVVNNTYIVDGLFNKLLRQQTKISFCAWLYSEVGTELNPLGVYAEKGLEMFGIFLHDNGSIGLHVNKAKTHEELIFPDLKIEYNMWDHYCVTWTGHNGETQIFGNGELKCILNDFMTGYTLPAGNKLWVKQLQYNNTDVTNPTKGFALKITDVNWWDRVITKKEVSQVYSCSGSLPGNVFSWNKDILEFYEAKQKKVCPDHPLISPLDKGDLDVEDDRLTYKVEGVFNKKLPSQTKLSFCAWLYTEKDADIDPLGVYDEDNTQIFGIFIHDDGSVSLQVGEEDNHEEYILPIMKNKPYSWDHYCITWSRHDGKTQVFVNGELKYLNGLMKGYTLPAGNKLKVKQLQYDNKDSNDPTKGFGLKITDINWWDHVITEDAVTEVYSCSGSLCGNIFSRNDDTLQLNEICLGTVTTSVVVSHNASLFAKGETIYVRADQKGVNPMMKNVSFCAWSFRSSSLTTRKYRILFVNGIEEGSGSFVLVANSKGYFIEHGQYYMTIKVPQKLWYHICATFESNSGTVQVYLDGKLFRKMEAFRGGKVIGISKVIIRQFQTEAFDEADPTKGFLTKTTAANLWDYVITDDIVHDAYCGKARGNVFNNDTEYEFSAH